MAKVSEQTRQKMIRVIRRALLEARPNDTALVAMLIPGHGIPLGHTCGAVLDHDLVRLEDPFMGWGLVFGRVRDEDRPGDVRAVSIPVGDIAMLSLDAKKGE